MKKNRFSFLIISIFVLSIFILLATFYINSVVILEKKEITTTLSIGKNGGFDLNSTALTFGTITSGGSSQRNVLIENNYEFPVVFEFNVKGNIKKFLVFDKVIYLDTGEKESVSITATTFPEDEYGDYSGKIIIVVKRDVNR